MYIHINEYYITLCVEMYHKVHTSGTCQIQNLGIKVSLTKVHHYSFTCARADLGDEKEGSIPRQDAG